MENGFNFYKNVLDNAENYNLALIKIIGEIDKKLRKTQKVFFEDLEERKMYLFCMDDCQMVFTITGEYQTLEVRIPNNLTLSADSDFTTWNEVYKSLTKKEIATDKQCVRGLFKAIRRQREILLDNGIKDSVFS